MRSRFHRPHPPRKESDCGFVQVVTPCAAGDCSVVLSVRAFEIHDALVQIPSVEGLLGIGLRSDSPTSAIRAKAVEDELLIFSNRLRLDVDGTLLGVWI